MGWRALARGATTRPAIWDSSPQPHLHHLISEVPSEFDDTLVPNDFRLQRLRYVDPQTYPEEQFQRTYDRMVGWGLTRAVLP
jgi:NitT/TauT family transport system substrate-binding protein